MNVRSPTGIGVKTTKGFCYSKYAYKTTRCPLHAAFHFRFNLFKVSRSDTYNTANTLFIIKGLHIVRLNFLHVKMVLVGMSVIVLVLTWE